MPLLGLAYRAKQGLFKASIALMVTEKSKNKVSQRKHEDTASKATQQIKEHKWFDKHFASVGLDPVFLQRSLNSSRHRFISQRFWSIMTRYHHDVKLPSHYIPKLLNWIEICGDCGGRLSTVNSLSYAREQFEMI